MINTLIKELTLHEGSNIIVDFSNTALAEAICAFCLSLFRSWKTHEPCYMKTYSFQQRVLLPFHGQGQLISNYFQINLNVFL